MRSRVPVINDPAMFEKWKATGVDTTKNMSPQWVRQPKLLGDIVEDTLELGRYDLAAENNMVPVGRIRSWLDDGKKQLDDAYTNNTDENLSPLAQFYLEIMQAKSLFISGRIRQIIQLADDPDPIMRGIYKNFHLWLVENIDETKRFAKWTNINQNTNVSHAGKVIVEYAVGNRWTSGGRDAVIDNSEVIDTKMLEAGPQVEDF